MGPDPQPYFCTRFSRSPTLFFLQIFVSNVIKTYVSIFLQIIGLATLFLDEVSVYSPGPDLQPNPGKYITKTKKIKKLNFVCICIKTIGIHNTKIIRILEFELSSMTLKCKSKICI